MSETLNEKLDQVPENPRSHKLGKAILKNTAILSAAGAAIFVANDKLNTPIQASQAAENRIVMSDNRGGEAKLPNGVAKLKINNPMDAHAAQGTEKSSADSDKYGIGTAVIKTMYRGGHAKALNPKYRYSDDGNILPDESGIRSGEGHVGGGVLSGTAPSDENSRGGEALPVGNEVFHGDKIALVERGGHAEAVPELPVPDESHVRSADDSK